MPYEVVVEPGTSAVVQQYMDDFVDVKTGEKIGEQVKSVVLFSGDVVDDDFLPQHLKDAVENGTCTMLVKVDDEADVVEAEAVAKPRKRGKVAGAETLRAVVPEADPFAEAEARTEAEKNRTD